MKKKLLSAAVRLAIGLVAVALVSYWWFSDAWFSENRKLRSDGVTLSAMVPLNIYISGSDDTRLNQNLTFDFIDFNELGFSNTFNLDSDDKGLKPASSNNGRDFWYAKKVNPNGHAIEDVPSLSTYGVVAQSDTTFFKERTIYIATTTEEFDNINSLDCYVSQVLIEGVDDNLLHRAARLSITATDDLGQETTIIYRYAANASDTIGQAFPVLDAHNKLATDPSVAMGSFEHAQAGALPITVKCAQSGVISVRALTVRIWFEGENSFAITDYSGGGFTFEIIISLVDPALGD